MLLLGLKSERKRGPSSRDGLRKQSPSGTRGSFPDHKATLVTFSLNQVPIKTASPLNFHSGAAARTCHQHHKLDGLWG